MSLYFIYSGIRSTVYICPIRSTVHFPFCLDVSVTTPLRYTLGTKHTHYVPCDRPFDQTKQTRGHQDTRRLSTTLWRFDASAPRATSRESTRETSREAHSRRIATTSSTIFSCPGVRASVLFGQTVGHTVRSVYALYPMYTVTVSSPRHRDKMENEPWIVLDRCIQWTVYPNK